MTKACGVVQPIGRGNFRADHELSRSDERFKSNRIVFERPCKAHAIRELGEAVPPQGPDPGSSQPLDKSSQVQVRGEVGLEDDDTRFPEGRLPGLRTCIARGVTRYPRSVCSTRLSSARR